MGVARNRLLIALVLPFIAALAATAIGSDTAVPADEIGRLVHQLGSDSFSQREHASRELIALGIATHDALVAATKDPDAEIRARAREILAIVSQSDFCSRLEAFSADFDGSQKRSLPGWDQFSTRMGSNNLARRLFVEMQRAEPELLEAYAKGGKDASEALDARCRNLMQQLTQVSGGDTGLSLGTLATLLLVGSAEDVTVEDQLAFQLYTWLIYRPAFQRNANSGIWAGMLRKLLGQWIVKDASPSATAQNLMFAASYELKPEGLNLAGRLLASDGTTVQIRQFALLTLGRFGGKEQVPTAEKFLEDASHCGAFGIARGQRQAEVQIRDVALAVVLHLTGQSLRDYGAVSVQPNPQSYFQVPALAFANPGARETALKHWHEWRMEHPLP
jgi:hypothetical protein